jgi:hypothetical protein
MLHEQLIPGAAGRSPATFEQLRERLQVACRLARAWPTSEGSVRLSRKPAFIACGIAQPGSACSAASKSASGVS